MRIKIQSDLFDTMVFDDIGPEIDPSSDLIIMMGIKVCDGIMTPTFGHADVVFSAEMAPWCGKGCYQLQVFDLRIEADISEQNCRKWGTPIYTETTALPGAWALLTVLPDDEGVSFELDDNRRCSGNTKVYPSWCLTQAEILISASENNECPLTHAKVLLDVIRDEARSSETVRKLYGLMISEDTSNVSFGSVSVDDVMKAADKITSKIGATFVMSPATIKKRIDKRAKHVRLDVAALAGEIAVELMSEGVGMAMVL